MYSGRLTRTRLMPITGMLTTSPYSRARRCKVPRGSLRTSSARPRMGMPLGPGGAWVPLVVIMRVWSSLHPSVVRNVEPTEDAVNDHPENRMVNAPGQSDCEHAAESPDADASRAPVATVAHGSSPCARNCALPV